MLNINGKKIWKSGRVSCNIVLAVIFLDTMRLLFLISFLTIFGCNYKDKSQCVSNTKQPLTIDTISGKSYYEAGLKNYKNADHEDYHDMDGLLNAKQYFEKAIKSGYDGRDVFEKLSMCYTFLDDKGNAERVYSLGLTHFPKDIEFYFYRGNIRKELKNHKGAFSDYDKVVSLDTTRRYFKDAVYYRGAMSYILGDKKSANADWKTAQKITDYELRTYPDYCQLWE